MLLLLTLLGGIALCLYGMKVMSEGILKVSGSHMRASLRGISNNRLGNLWTGTWITAIIQSSSAMTLMTVSLVNAGLLTLGQSIALTMGANVGTTLTAWIIATLGFGWNLGYLAIPMVILALPFSYVRLARFRPWGEILMGAALYLLGFTTFISLMPSPDQCLADPTLVARLAGWGWWGVLLSVLVGVCLTFVFRSSSATILIAMALVSKGWVEFPVAAGLVIGDNVGTTLTALIAARHANISARRASYSHLLFNLFGMVWALVLIYPISEAIWIVLTLLKGGEIPGPAAMAFAIALFHTAFNLATALMLIGFIPQFKLLLAKLLPISEGDEDEFHLHFIQGGLLSTAELSVEEARKEATLFGVRCQKMLQLTSQFMHLSPDHPNYIPTFTRIEKYEKITDRLELEIVRYLNQIDKSAISGHMAARTRSLFRMVDELESIGDACYKMARTVLRKNEHKVKFINMQQQNIDRVMQLTQEAVDQMVRLLQKPELTSVDMQRAYNQEDAINALRGQYRDQNIANVQSGYYTYQSGTLYMDLVNSCEKLGDYVVNVLEAHDEQSNFDASEP